MKMRSTLHRQTLVGFFGLACCLVYAAVQAETRQALPPAPQTTHVVQAGETLSRVAQRYYGDAAKWPLIYQANRALIQEVSHIKVGWSLRIPEPDRKAAFAARPGEAGAVQASAATPVIVAALDAAPPFASPGLPQQGMLTEIVRAVFTKLDVPLDLVWSERAAALQAVQAGTIAAAFPSTKTTAQQLHLLSSRPLYHGTVWAFVRRGTPAAATPLERLNGSTVCQPAGGAAEKLQTLAAQQRLTIQTLPSLDACVQLLLQAKVDAVLAEELEGQKLLAGLGSPTTFCRLDEPMGSDTLHIVLPQRSPQGVALVQALDHALEQLENTGVLPDIVSRHIKAARQSVPVPVGSCAAEPSVPPGVDPQALVFQPQPGEFMTVVPPKRRAQELELVSVPVKETPTLDGRAAEALWKTAPVVETLDYASQRPLTLQSVHTTEEIFFLVTYPDRAPSETHRSWGWDANEGVYKPLGDREDVFVFKWSMVGNRVNLSFRDAQPHRADIWYWKARRTNPMGYADDKMQIVQPEFQKDTAVLASPSYGSLYLVRPGDEGRAAFEEKIFYTYQGDVLPRFYAQQPQGSRADVRAKGTWSQGLWTIEFGRKLKTGHDDDLAFDLGGVYLFAVSCYEMAYGRVEAELTQPLYKLGDAFDHLLLRIARGNEG